MRHLNYYSNIKISMADKNDLIAGENNGTTVMWFIPTRY